MGILVHSCTWDKKEHILRKVREHIDGLLATNPHHQIYQAGGDAIPEHDPHWNCEDHVGQARMRHCITCLLEGMKRCMVKPVNYDKFQEVTQEKDENSAVFLIRLTEAFMKYTNTDPESRGEDTTGHEFCHPGYS